jgi:hypothetical protein
MVVPGWPTHKAGGLRPSSTPLDTPRCTSMVVNGDGDGLDGSGLDCSAAVVAVVVAHMVAVLIRDTGCSVELIMILFIDFFKNKSFLSKLKILPFFTGAISSKQSFHVIQLHQGIIYKGVWQGHPS